MLAYTPGTAVQALQRLAASNPMLYKALLHMKKDSHGCISAATLMQVSCNAVCKLLTFFRCQTSLHRSKLLECFTCSKLTSVQNMTPDNETPDRIRFTLCT